MNAPEPFLFEIDLVDFDVGRFCVVDDDSAYIRAGSTVTRLAFDTPAEQAKIRWDRTGRCFVPGTCNYRIVDRFTVAG